MPTARIDLSDAPIIDHHMHSLLRLDQPIELPRYQGLFTESPNPVMKAQYVPDTIMWQWSIRDLAAYLGCDPTSESVLTARNVIPLPELANRMWRDQNCEALFIDYGLRGAENYSPEEMRAMIDLRIELILRIETFAQDLILQHDTFDQFIDAFVAGIESARRTGHVGLKSIICYRTGLDIGWVTRDEAARAFEPIKEQARRDGAIRLASKPLCDYLVVRALEVANRDALPIQFHTGLGDTDLDMLKANPLHLRTLLQSGKFDNVPFVLLHGSYPYVRELGYLAAMYPNVYMDISLAIPFITTAIPIMIREALGLTPTTKILYASDAFSIPDLFWLANRWGRAALEQVLGEIVDAGALTVEQAKRAGRQILGDNARRVYGL